MDNKNKKYWIGRETEIPCREPCIIDSVIVVVPVVGELIFLYMGKNILCDRESCPLFLFRVQRNRMNHSLCGQFFRHRLYHRSVVSMVWVS